MALLLAQNENIAMCAYVHLSAWRLETVRLPRAQHFNLQFPIELAHVAAHFALPEHGFNIALQATLEYSGVQEIKRILNGIVPLFRELWIFLSMVVGHLAADSGMTS